jgi:hypothetical protein
VVAGRMYFLTPTEVQVFDLEGTFLWKWGQFRDNVDFSVSGDYAAVLDGRRGDYNFSLPRAGTLEQFISTFRVKNY